MGKHCLFASLSNLLVARAFLVTALVLFIPLSTQAASVPPETKKDPKSCAANGLWCKCGFQSIFWAYERIEAGKKDCYTLEGVCQLCGVAERITAIGFDYSYEKQGSRDVYSFHYVRQMENWWHTPKYASHCQKGHAVQGIKSGYSAAEDRDVYSLQIKCGKMETAMPKERIPTAGITWYNCETKEQWTKDKTEWCALNGYMPKVASDNYIDGPRVFNGATDPAYCSTWYGTLDEAAAKCSQDAACSVLHDYNCDGNSWRYCTASLQTIQAVSTDTKACTKIPQATAPGGGSRRLTADTVLV